MAETVIVAGTAEAGKVVLARAEEVRSRTLPVYDYEKVFWNSTFSVGLLGLGYVAVKIGQFIAGLSFDVSQAARITSDPDKASYDWLYPYCDPDGAHYTDPYPGTHGTVVQYYRDNPAEWEDYKARILGKYGEGSDKPSGTASILQVIDALGGFFDKYGPILPVSVVAAHAVVEFLNKRKFLSKNERLIGFGLIGAGAVGTVLTLFPINLPKESKKPEESKEYTGGGWVPNPDVPYPEGSGGGAR